ncbi:MAG: SUMF1/EgtB/PvdO family nonheme iron enzyme [Cyanobacteria bacterium P01_A01_bin.3]
MSKLFVSYSRQDEAIAATLIEDLKTLGHTVWFDLELTGGQVWWDRILANIRECDVFAFILSPNSQNSTACKREYRYADALKKPILPVLVADGINANLLPPALAKVQFADYRRRDSTTALLLARAFNTLPSPSPLPDPLPQPPSAPISYLGGLLEQIESPANLSYEAQSTLLLDLKRGVRDSGTHTDTLLLLETLKKRRDIYASIRDEIDDLLESCREEAVETLEPTDRTPAQTAQPPDNLSDRTKPNRPLIEPIPPEPKTASDSSPEVRKPSVTSERAPATQSVRIPTETTRQPSITSEQNEPIQSSMRSSQSPKGTTNASLETTKPPIASFSGEIDRQTSLSASNLSRRRALQLAGFGGAGVGLALLVRALSSNQNEASPTISTVTPSPTPSSIATSEPTTVEVEYTVVTVDERGNEVGRENKQNQYRSVNLGNGIQMGMVNIPAGNFLMGSPQSEESREDGEGPQREVIVPSFWMGLFQVTQAQWQAVAELPKVERDLNSDPSSFKGEELPVVQINRWQVKEFCERLSATTGCTYRLPSEAEWEYACRAGTTTPFHFGETITTDLANYNGFFRFASGPRGESRRQTTPVGSFGVANGFGLYDMHGNVWEWCEDVWHENYEGVPLGGSPWIEGGDSSRRVLRGGYWDSFPGNCRSAARSRLVADNRGSNVGFRVVCSSA